MADAAFDHIVPKAVSVAQDQHLRDMANCIRFLSMDAVQQAKSGHPGAPMGMADIATVLFREFMQFERGIRTGSIATASSCRTAMVDAALQPALPDRL